MRPRSPVVTAILAVALALAAPATAVAQDSIPSLLERVGSLRSQRVRESSGAALSRQFPGVLWTHNDSGDKTFVYAVSLSGDVLAAVNVNDARATDWEDLALATCPAGGQPCLYIADTGDNSEKRKFVSVFIAPEMDPRTARIPGDTLISAPSHEVRITYPDGSHDVEAIYVDPSGTLSLISKGRSGNVVRYTISRTALLRDSVVAQLADTLPIIPQRTLGRLITGAAISPSGRRVVARTYSELYFFRRSEDGRLRPDGAPCWLGAAEPQGEGVTWVDETTLLLTSESLPNQDGPISRVRCTKTRQK